MSVSVCVTSCQVCLWSIDLILLFHLIVWFPGKDTGNFYWHGRDKTTNKELNPKVLYIIIFYCHIFCVKRFLSLKDLLVFAHLFYCTISNAWYFILHFGPCLFVLPSKFFIVEAVLIILLLGKQKKKKCTVPGWTNATWKEPINIPRKSQHVSSTM